MDDLLKAAAEGNLSREEITETASKLLKMGEEAESAWVQTGKSVVGYSIESLAKLNPRLSAETVMELYEMLLERFRKIISLGLDSNEITGVFREIDFNFAIYDSDFASYRTVCSVTRTSPDTGNEYRATCTLNEPREYMLSVFARDSNRNNAAKSVRFTVGEGGSGGGGSGGGSRSQPPTITQFSYPMYCINDGSSVTVTFSASAPNGLKEARLYADGQLATSTPLSGSSVNNVKTEI